MSVLYVHINRHMWLECVTQTYPVFSVLIWAQALCICYVVVCPGKQSTYDYLTCLHIWNVKQPKEKQITNYLYVSVLNYY